MKLSAKEISKPKLIISIIVLISTSATLIFIYKPINYSSEFYNHTKISGKTFPGYTPEFRFSQKTTNNIEFCTNFSVSVGTRVPKTRYRKVTGIVTGDTYTANLPVNIKPEGMCGWVTIDNLFQVEGHLTFIHTDDKTESSNSFRIECMLKETKSTKYYFCIENKQDKEKRALTSKKPSNSIYHKSVPRVYNQAESIVIDFYESPNK